MQQTVKTQQRIHQRASQGRLDNMQRDPEETFEGRHTAHFSVREKTPSTHEPAVQTKHCGHSSPTKDVFIGLLLHLSTLAAPPDDFVLPACTVACARSPAGRRLPPRHPKTARALQFSMPKRTASLPPPDAEWSRPCKRDKPSRGRNGVPPTVADALSFDATEGPGA